MLEVEYFDKKRFDVRGIHIEINVYDLLVELVQFGDFLYQLEKRRLGLAARIDAFQVPAQEVIIGVLQDNSVCIATASSDKPFSFGKARAASA